MILSSYVFYRKVKGTRCQNTFSRKKIIETKTYNRVSFHCWIYFSYTKVYGFSCLSLQVKTCIIFTLLFDWNIEFLFLLFIVDNVISLNKTHRTSYYILDIYLTLHFVLKKETKKVRKPNKMKSYISSYLPVIQLCLWILFFIASVHLHMKFNQLANLDSACIQRVRGKRIANELLTDIPTINERFQNLLDRKLVASDPEVIEMARMLLHPPSGHVIKPSIPYPQLMREFQTNQSRWVREQFADQVGLIL